MYTLDYVSSVYKVPLANMCHHNYWPPYEGPQLYTNLFMRKKKVDWNQQEYRQMDERETDQPKCCSIYRLIGHSKNKCIYRLESSNQEI